jgi:diacylglycerol kinase family enzyme
MIANFGAVLGNRLPLGPGIRHDDGLLDLCVLAPRSRADGLRALARLARRDLRSDPALVYRPGRQFRVETDLPHTAQADGELLGVTPFVVEAVPRAATLLVPAEPPSASSSAAA